MRALASFVLAAIVAVPAASATGAADSTDQLLCAQAPTVECMMRCAIDDAERSPQKSPHRLSLSLDIVDALVKLGRTDDAFAFAAGMTDDDTRDLALVRLAPALASHSEAKALLAVARIGDSRLRQIAMLHSAASLADHDDFAAALRFATAIEHPMLQARAWALVAERSGDGTLMERAWATALAVADDQERARALTDVASASRRAPHIAAALAVVRALDDRRARADELSALARASGDDALFADAAADALYAARYGRDRAAHRALIANLLAAARTDLALVVAAQIPFNEARDPALAEIAAAFQAAGRYGEAERAAAMIADRALGAVALGRIAVASRSGEAADRAIAMARRELLPYARARALWKLGILMERPDLAAEGAALAFADASAAERAKVLALLVPELAGTRPARR